MSKAIPLISLVALLGIFVFSEIVEARPRNRGGGLRFNTGRGSLSERAPLQGRMNHDRLASRTVEKEVEDGYRKRTVEIEGADGKTIQHEVQREKNDEGHLLSRELETSEGFESSTVRGVSRDESEVTRGVAHRDSRDDNSVQYGSVHREDGEISIHRGEIEIDHNHGYYYYVPGYASPYYYPYHRPTTVVIQQSAKESVTGEIKGSLAPVNVVPTARSPVYTTSYTPPAIYSEKHGEKIYWVPGALKTSDIVRSAIDLAKSSKKQLTSGVAIYYEIGSETVYLTHEPPIAGIFQKRAGDLYAWISGVKDPSSTEKEAITLAVKTHRQGGATQLASNLKAGK